MLEPTLDALASTGLLSEIATVTLDRSYDYPAIRARLQGPRAVRLGHPTPRHQGAARHPASAHARAALDRRGHQDVVVELRPASPQHRPQDPPSPRRAPARHRRTHRRPAHRLPQPLEPQLTAYSLKSSAEQVDAIAPLGRVSSGMSDHASSSTTRRRTGPSGSGPRPLVSRVHRMRCEKRRGRVRRRRRAATRARPPHARHRRALLGYRDACAAAIDVQGESTQRPRDRTDRAHQTGAVADAATPPSAASARSDRPKAWTAEQLRGFLDFAAESPCLPRGSSSPQAPAGGASASVSAGARSTWTKGRRSSPAR